MVDPQVVKLSENCDGSQFPLGGPIPLDLTVGAKSVVSVDLTGPKDVKNRFMSRPSRVWEVGSVGVVQPLKQSY